MALETYRGKRDFGKTPEPEGGETPANAAGDAYAIQKHAARRLHYDLRLERGGVLWSWAVTRGPSLVPGEKRLSVRTEDHPLEYGDFEGVIPEGEYGGGTVLLWDRGTWTPIGDPERGMKKGHLEFEIEGERLKGRWHLVRMGARPREKAENWLLIKGEDGFARAEGDPDVLEEFPNSVKTGRGLEAVATEAPGWSAKTGRIAPKADAGSEAEGAAEAPARAAPKKPPRMKGAVERAFPGFVPPALATLRPEAPAGERWLHEIKFDGYRLQAHLRDGAVTLLTRTGLDWTDRFGPEITGALAALPAEAAIVDGELVVERPGGASDFSALQDDLSSGRTDRFAFYALDLLYLDGRDLREAALVDRKAALEALTSGADSARLRFSGHFEDDGEVILRHACRLSLEGVVSKLKDAPYRSGRGKAWIKSKCLQRQEFVVLGYAPSSVSKKAVGALLLGHHEEGALVAAGRVGTGFSQRAAEDLLRRLEPLARPKPAFAGPVDAATRREMRFVEPELVAEVEFRAWTAAGILRHASFRGLRDDKPASEIVREAAAGPDGASGEPLDKPAPAVKLTHPDRIYWKDAGVTKEGLAAHYSEVWPWMAPHVARRPLALLRCPDGVDGQRFFQKHAWRGMNREILTLTDPLDEGEDATLIAVDGPAGMMGLVQGAALEIHTWQSSLDDLERPDQIVMDLDPAEDVGLEAVIAAAREVRERLKAAGLESFVKTSGGKGFHVVAPLVPKAGWAPFKAFAKGVADAMAADAPERFVSVVTKSKRAGRILVDYLRNGRGATAVAPYSTRARSGAPVSMPLAWDELDPAVGPAYYTVAAAAARLANLRADPWEGFRDAAAPLPGPAKKAAKPRARRTAKPAAGGGAGKAA